MQRVRRFGNRRTLLDKGASIARGQRQRPTEQAEMINGPKADERNRLRSGAKIFHHPRTPAVEPRNQVRRRRHRPTAGGRGRKGNRRLRVREVAVGRSPG